MCESKAGHYKAEKSYFNSFFFSAPQLFSELLSPPKAMLESPHCTGGNAVPITAAAGVRPWQQASNLPQTGCKMTNYPGERLGRKDLEKYGFYLIQLNHKRN